MHKHWPCFFGKMKFWIALSEKQSHMGELSEFHSQRNTHIDGRGKRSENKASEFSLVQAVFAVRAP